MDSLLTRHSIRKVQSAYERVDLAQPLMHLEWNIFIKLIQEAVMPYLNYSFIIVEQQPVCGLWNPGKVRCRIHPNVESHYSWTAGKCWALWHLLDSWSSGSCDQFIYFFIRWTYPLLLMNIALNLKFVV